HRLSAVGRSSGRLWAYGFRNSLWSAVMHLPAPRLFGELGWKLVVNTLEMARLGEPRWGAWAFASFVRGLPRALRLRRPLTRQALRRYDALRFREVRTAAELAQARGLSAGERWRWFRDTWLRRRRARPWWDRRPGALGESRWRTGEPGT
ncbi:MAG TPA: hypothetical protein VF541_04080, partial [Longimicrobium sp.]